MALPPDDMDKLKKIYIGELEFGKKKIIEEDLNSLSTLRECLEGEVKNVQ